MTAKARFFSVATIFGLCLVLLSAVLLVRPAGPAGTGSMTVTFAGLTNDSSGAVLVQFKATNAHSRRVSFGIGEVQVLQSNAWPNWMRVAGGSNWLGVAAGSDRVFSIAGSPLSRDTWRVPIIYAEDSSTVDDLRMRAKGIAWVISHWRPGRPLPSPPYAGTADRASRAALPAMDSGALAAGLPALGPNKRGVRMNARADDMIFRAAGLNGEGHPLARPHELATLLERLRFNPEIVPPTPRAVYRLEGTVISTPGNLTAITSAVKTGKSAVIGAMAAAAMATENAGDLLGFVSSNPEGFALLHFDSEQSPDDHWHHIHRAVVRAGLQAPPPWFYSYCLTGLGSKRALECVTYAIKEAAERHKGIHSVLIDGIADLIVYVNDAAESNALVSRLHEMAIHHKCPIVGVIHFNPSSEKVRGHLGSQFSRKAETNLRLDKSNGVTNIWSDKQRRAPIPKDAGQRFEWSDRLNMHVSVQSQKGAKGDEEKAELSDLAQKLFHDQPSFGYSKLRSAVRKALTVSESTAERTIKRMRNLGIIEKRGAGSYVRKA